MSFEWDCKRLLIMALPTPVRNAKIADYGFTLPSFTNTLKSVSFRNTVWPEPIWMKIKKSRLLLSQPQSTYPRGQKSAPITLNFYDHGQKLSWTYFFLTYIAHFFDSVRFNGFWRNHPGWCGWGRGGSWDKKNNSISNYIIVWIATKIFSIRRELYAAFECSFDLFFLNLKHVYQKMVNNQDLEWISPSITQRLIYILSSKNLAIKSKSLLQSRFKVTLVQRIFIRMKHKIVILNFWFKRTESTFEHLEKLPIYEVCKNKAF